MNDPVRETLRQRLERTLETIRPPSARRALQPVVLKSGLRVPSRRNLRPVRAWSKLTREDLLGARPRHFSH